MTPASLLDRALTFWEDLYDSEIQRRAAIQAESPWAGTPAQQHLLMERALLRLWRMPGEAVRELYELFRGPLESVIRRHLGLFAPAGFGGEDQAELPWRWQTRSAVEKAMLQEMGLGGEAPSGTLQRPGRLWLAIGLCGGLALACFNISLLSEWIIQSGPKPALEPSVQASGEVRDVTHLFFSRLPVSKVSSARWVNDATALPGFLAKPPKPRGAIGIVQILPQTDVEPPKDKPHLWTTSSNRTVLEGENLIFESALSVLEKATSLRGYFITLGDSAWIDDVALRLGYSRYTELYRVSVSNRMWPIERLVPPGSKVRVRFEVQERPCIARESGTEVWRCGTRVGAAPPKLPNARRSSAVLAASPRSLETRRLANLLLDTGSADVVAFAPDLARLDLRRFLGPSAQSSDSQVLYFSPAKPVNSVMLPSLSLRAKQAWITVDDWSAVATNFLHIKGVGSANALRYGVQSVSGDAAEVMLRGLP